MNIFFLSESPEEAARFHCDAHVVKMILEAAQMLSTAHRMLDGTEMTVHFRGRKKKIWVHPDKEINYFLYKVTHRNHPSNIWTREASANYEWHYRLFVALCDEYTYRYGKIHKTDALLRDILSRVPSKIKTTNVITEVRKAMKSEPLCLRIVDPVQAYRAFYQTKKFKMEWTKRPVPYWFEAGKSLA